MCGKYKDKEKYLEVSIGIVDDLTKMIVEILSISSFQEIKEKKEILKLKDEVNNILICPLRCPISSSVFTLRSAFLSNFIILSVTFVISNIGEIIIFV